MSTGLNCEFVQVAPQKWYYLLEGGSAPKNAWDWREHADAYGPFQTLERAQQHLGDNHANPGGYSVNELPEGVAELDLSEDDTLRGLIEKAIDPSKQSQTFSYRPYWRGWRQP